MERPQETTPGAGPGHQAGSTAQAADGVPAVRASDRDRDSAAQRLQEAFAEGRLDDTEFDRRMRAALTAVTHADLGTLLADLPAASGAGRPGAAVADRPGRFAVALKSSVRRGGRWRVPERYTAVVYKGGGLLDLRAAELSGPLTTIVTVAYKSRVTILVPPGVRAEMTGFGVTQGAHDEPDDFVPGPGAPVLHIRGIAYKGTIEVSARPPDRRSLP